MVARVVSLNSSFKPHGLERGDLDGPRRCAILNFTSAKAKKPQKPKKPPNPESVAIGQAIRRRRQLLKMKLAELAHLLDCSEGQMSKWERGENALNWPQIRQIAYHLKVPATALCRRAEPASPETLELQETIDELPIEQQRHLLAFLRGGKVHQA